MTSKTLKWILKDADWGAGTGLTGSEQGKLAGCCEHGDEHRGSVKCGGFVV
jgi:hypothetical protein